MQVIFRYCCIFNYVQYRVRINMSESTFSFCSIKFKNHVDCGVVPPLSRAMLTLIETSVKLFDIMDYQ